MPHDDNNNNTATQDTTTLPSPSGFGISHQQKRETNRTDKRPQRQTTDGPTEEFELQRPEFQSQGSSTNSCHASI